MGRNNHGDSSAERLSAEYGAMTAPSVSIDCGAEDSGFFLTGCDISSNEVAKPKEKVKKRRSKKKDTDDWLSELHAMHSAVGDYFGEPETKEDQDFFVQARRTEHEVEQLGKEIEVEVECT